MIIQRILCKGGYIPSFLLVISNALGRASRMIPSQAYIYVVTSTNAERSQRVKKISG